MPLREVRIDERTWAEAHEHRRREWEVTIRELTTPGEAVLREDGERLDVSQTQQGVELALFDGDGKQLAEVAIPHDRLGDLVTQYVDIVREIARADAMGGLKRLEALDMAKRVTHDDAGRFLERRCRPFGIDHPTGRRLFTLLLALKVDTTRLIGVHGHRRVR
ncbi:MAG: hypothetical protein CMN30_32455 [Sandaracinus sp.]|nr:hypothetical protein [Sandaracinus sp.]|tara:strand:- start:100 stop:588 length:489 start_codon:yes stop_codon:yes gene_type:complete